MAGVVCILALLLPTEGDLEQQELKREASAGKDGDKVR